MQQTDTKKDLVITRIFDAPRNIVWQMWTEPERVKQWWGPKVFTAPVVKIDFRVGGKYLYCMRGPGGKDYWSTGTYKEIVPDERLVVTDSFADKEGHVVPAVDYGMDPNFPIESKVIITFEEAGGKTRFTLKYEKIPNISESDLKNMEQGWNESFDKLAERLTKFSRTVINAEPRTQDIFITRDFDAPRDLIFRAFTDPELYVQWLGLARFKMTLEIFEPRNGGRWRFIQEDKDGNKFGFHGVFHELSPELMIDTFEFEGLPEKGHVSLETARLEELPGGRTRFKQHSVFQSVEDRDGMMQSGMEEGVNESYDRLDALLEKMKGGMGMLKLGSIMIGSSQPKALADFYGKIIGKASDWSESGWYGWQMGENGFWIGEHSEVKGKAKEPQRILLNFESEEVKKEYERIKALGVKVIKELYEMEDVWIATFADPDGNYFQVMSPWKG